jgi:hypothetical protein
VIGQAAIWRVQRLMERGSLAEADIGAGRGLCLRVNRPER